MGALTQSSIGYDNFILPVCCVLARTVYNHLLKADNLLSLPSQPALHIAHATVPLAPSKVILEVAFTPTTLSTSVAVVICVCLVLLAGALSLMRWSYKSAAISKGPSRQATASPSLHSPSAHELQNPPNDEADMDDSDYTPSEGEDDEADGDGDDYPGYDMDDELDGLEEEEVEDSLSPSEDPPPPPDPPSQTDAADPDPKPKEVPWWYLILLAMFTVTGFSLVKRASLRLRRTLRRIKIYPGSSLFHLYIYVEDPTCRGLVRTTAISSLAGASGLVVPFHAGDLGIIKRTVDLDSAIVLDVLLLPPMLKIVVALALLLAGIVIDVCWRERVGKDNELELLADGNTGDLPGIEEVYMHADVVKGSAVPVSDLPGRISVTLVQEAQHDFTDVILFLFLLRLILLLYLQATVGSRLAKPRIRCAPASFVVDAQVSNTIQSLTPDFDDHEVEIVLLPSVTATEANDDLSIFLVGNPIDINSGEEDLVSRAFSFCLSIPSVTQEDRIDDQVRVISELDLSIIPHLALSCPELEVFDSAGMSILQGSTGSFIEEVLEEELGDASFVLEDPIPVKDEAQTSPSVISTALTVWRGECIVSRTPRRILPLTYAPVIGTPARSSVRSPSLPLLPKRVLELRGIRPSSPLPIAIMDSNPKQVRRSCRSFNTTAASPFRSMDQASVAFSDSSQSDLVSVVSDDLPSFVGEVEQSTLVEEDSGVMGKANIAPKLSEVEEVVVDRDNVAPDVMELELEERQKKEGSEGAMGCPRVDEEADVVVIVDEEQLFGDEEVVLAVDEKSVEAIQTSTLAPAPSYSEEDDEKESISALAKEDGEHGELIDFVDGAGVYRYFMPHLALYQSLSPVTIAGPAVPTPPPSLVYCPCCPDMELEWDELSMVDDVLAELRCFELPYGISEQHFDLAAIDDVEDLKDDGVDLRMWGVGFVIIEDEEGEEEDVKCQLLDGTYEEEDAVWMKDSAGDDDDEEEEEVEMELLAGLFDESVNDQDTGDETLDLSEILMDFYGPDGSKAELLINVTPPDFDAADIFDVFDDFLPVWEDVFRSTPTTQPSTLAEDLCVPLLLPVPSLDQDSPLDAPSQCDLSSSGQEIATTPVLGEAPPLITLDPIHCGAPTSDPDINVQVGISSPTVAADDPAPQESDSEPSATPISKERLPDHAVLDTSMNSLSLLTVVEAKRGDGPASRIHHQDIHTGIAGDVDEVAELCGREASMEQVDADHGSEKTWPWRRVAAELQHLQSKEDLHRWQLRPVKPTLSLATSELENELQRMRARLRPPLNMTPQEKRVRQIWSMQGTEKGRVLKEQHSRKAAEPERV